MGFSWDLDALSLTTKLGALPFLFMKIWRPYDLWYDSPVHITIIRTMYSEHLAIDFAKGFERQIDEAMIRMKFRFQGLVYLDLHMMALSGEFITAVVKDQSWLA